MHFKHLLKLIVGEVPPSILIPYSITIRLEHFFNFFRIPTFDVPYLSCHVFYMINENWFSIQKHHFSLTPRRSELIYSVEYQLHISLNVIYTFFKGTFIFLEWTDFPFRPLLIPFAMIYFIQNRKECCIAKGVFYIIAFWVLLMKISCFVHYSDYGKTLYISWYDFYI